MSAHQFLWLAIQTTGLDAAQGHILEVAAVLCEDAAGDDFAVVHEFASVVHFDRSACFSIAPEVERMHAASGLWEACEISETTIADVDAFLCELVTTLTGKPRGRISIACANAVWLLPWIHSHLPGLAQRITRTTLDVAALTAAARAWGSAPPAWTAPAKQRASDAVHAAISNARAARASLRGAP